MTTEPSTAHLCARYYAAGRNDQLGGGTLIWDVSPRRFAKAWEAYDADAAEGFARNSDIHMGQAYDNYRATGYIDLDPAQYIAVWINTAEKHYVGLVGQLTHESAQAMADALFGPKPHGDVPPAGTFLG